MTFFEDLRDSVSRIAVFEELDVDVSVLPVSAMGLSDASVRDLLGETAVLARQVGVLQAVLAGVASARSGRDVGHGGLVQESGHRNTVELIRDLAGVSRGEAVRAVKVGEALVGAGPGLGASGSGDAGGAGVEGGPDGLVDAAVSGPWHAPLDAVLLAGVVSTAQHHAIRAGLGEPPLIDGRPSETVVEVWRAAATELAAEAALCTVEDLGARARVLKDMLDPAGAEDRFAARYAKRSYRTTVDGDGVRRGYIVFDDEMGAWLETVFATALSPRRGGPRFVADDDKRAADALENDPRTNEQLAYDLLMDVLRAGALADAKTVFGTKEPGVRLVVMKDTLTGETAHRDAFGRLVATACTEDGQVTLPGSVLERALCATGTAEVTVDGCGNPLDVGREQRLFTPKQRTALAIRDGGCLWPGCDRPPEHCEAHHIDHWATGGSTDCDRGILLCRYHHLHLHNTGWWITRESTGLFLLHPPARAGGEPIILQSKSPLRWLWDPPPDRPHWRLAA